jgi:hypothetical protein
MNINEHIIRIDFSIAYCNSDSKPINGTEQEFVVLFNDNIISEEEVNKLINSGMYENDQRIVIMTKLQADNLLGITKEAAAKQLFVKLTYLKDCIIEEIRYEPNETLTELLNELKCLLKNYNTNNINECDKKYHELLKKYNKIINKQY